MSWDLSSEEVIVDKLENQQRTIFAFSKKIKELQTELDALKLEYDKLTDWASEYNAENLRLSTIVNNQKTVIDINQAENAKLRECVEFYADKENWGKTNQSTMSRIGLWDCDLSGAFNHRGIDYLNVEIGGKRARACLKELEEK